LAISCGIGEELQGRLKGTGSLIQHLELEAPEVPVRGSPAVSTAKIRAR